MYISRRLLWVDCTAGALGGVTVLAFSAWLSRLHALPHDVLLFLGAANLLYASYSFSLAVRSERPMPLIKLLVYANAAWVLVCLALLAIFFEHVTVFGIGHLVGEALFVGRLAAIEWRERAKLVTTAGVQPLERVVPQ